MESKKRNKSKKGRGDQEEVSDRTKEKTKIREEDRIFGRARRQKSENSSYDLMKLCCVSISFAKGWGKVTIGLEKNYL